MFFSRPEIVTQKIDLCKSTGLVKIAVYEIVIFVRILTWQVPVLSAIPTEQSVVSCTMFPKDNWHSSLETTLTFNLFNTGLIDDAKNS